jgi:carotenoid 9,10(9',10')-cleavage dioxygenase 1
MKGWWGLILMLMHRVAGVEAKLYDMPAGNTALVWHCGKLLALMEGSVPFLLRVSEGSVQSMYSYDFRGSLEHEFCAHPKVDPRTGEMICFACKCVSSVRVLEPFFFFNDA